MARKKIILFIVEGFTDQESLELLLGEIIDDSEVIFEITRGDITTDRSVDSSNIKEKITDIIKDGGKRKFKPSDYKEVIHLVDTDGSYISEDNIYKDKELAKFKYTDEGIYANNIQDVIDRNEKKSKLLNQLITIEKVFRSVPYRVFYFSCNLEHVLHNERDVNDKEKIKYSEKFQDKYIDTPQEFIKLFCESDFTVHKDYKDSWEFIKVDNNSIKRFSNFNIVLKDYI